MISRASREQSWHSTPAYDSFFIRVYDNYVLKLEVCILRVDYISMTTNQDRASSSPSRSTFLFVLILFSHCCCDETDREPIESEKAKEQCTRVFSFRVRAKYTCRLMNYITRTATGLRCTDARIITGASGVISIQLFNILSFKQSELLMRILYSTGKKSLNYHRNFITDDNN